MKTIKVLGALKCSTCTNLKEKIDTLIKENNIEATVEKITDIVEIMGYGVMSTPAIVVDEKVILSGRIPDKDEIIKILQS